MKDSPVTVQISEGELYASRYNVGLARSQKVLQSWLPAKPDATSSAMEEDDDSDFKPVSETAGLDAETRDDEDSVSDALRRSRASQDKLLEQLLGKKAAQAKKKSLEDSRKGAFILKHATSKSSTPSKPLKPAVTQSDDEEEEEGRAAAFSSRKKWRETRAPASVVPGSKTDNVLLQDAKPPDHREGLANVDEMIHEQAPVDEVPRSKKRKANSYLDEVLASKAKKTKSKKNRNKGKETASQ